jgi:hypothetical protein
MRYDDYEPYDYNYDDLAENADDLYEYESLEQDDEDEVPSYGRNYYPDITEDDC